MNLFWKKLFGKISSTEKFEDQLNAFERGMLRYLEIEKSDNFQEYKKLHELINSSGFQNKKQVLKNKKYKSTDEFATISKLKKIQKNKDVKRFFETQNSTELKEYLDYKSSPAFEKNLLEHKNTDDTKKFTKFEKSKQYRNYIKLNDSYVIKEYKELEIKTASDEFQKQNEFWKNKKRWEQSEEYFQEQRYLELQKNPDIAFYLTQKPDTVEKYKSRKTLFEDNFDKNLVDHSLWQFGYHYEAPLIGDFSYSNELQANKSGKNTEILNKALCITTRKDNLMSRAWHPVKGFVEKEFEYSADVIQNGNAFKTKYGVFQIKMKASGNVHHALWLAAQKPLPLIQIAQIYGKKISFGLLPKEGAKKTISITGINPAEYFIYTLIWNKDELIWKINNFEVFRVSHNIPNDELYLGINSFLKETEKAAEGKLEIDQIKIYSSLVP